MRFPSSLFLAAASWVLSIVATADSALAQISSDGTLSTQIRLSGNEFQVQGGTTVGQNLFHSFSEFSIPSGFIASFNNLPNIGNIISRVTGGSPSNINGILKANGTANLFLLNPNGIIFGPDAQLSLGGSFIASTANSLKFADGTDFSTNIQSTPSLLTMSIPSGLQFGNNPGSIVNRSQLGLKVAPGQTLALVGGNISIEGGKLKAPAGRIELGSVAGNNIVTLTSNNQGWQLGYNNISQFQDISLSQNARVFVDATERGGVIQIYGRNIQLSEGTQIELSTSGVGSTGDLTINASETFELIGASGKYPNITGLFLQVIPPATGNAGNLFVQTQKLILRNGATIDASTFSKGRGGQVFINADEFVKLIGVGLQIPTIIATATSKPYPTDDVGNGGTLTINTRQLIVQDGAQITTFTQGNGNGGNLTINALDSIIVTGQGRSVNTLGRAVEFSSRLSTTSGFEDVNSTATGAAGNLNINTGRLIVSNGGEIAVGSFRGGEAGNLSINARSVLLNQGKLTAESTSGAGGNIFINASDLLLLRHNGLISATAGIEGSGGNGGNIDINAKFIIAVPNENSDISANAFTGNGGNVTITSSGIFGTQFREIPTLLSDITVSSEFGSSGIVTFNRPDVDPQSSLITLPSEVVDAANLVVQACNPGGAYTRGEFYITGRGGIPAAPYNAIELNTGLPDLGSDSPQIDLRQGNYKTPSSDYDTKLFSNPETIIEAQGWMMDAQGKIILTAQAPNVTSNHPGLTSPNCQSLPALSLSESNQGR